MSDPENDFKNSCEYMLYMNIIICLPIIDGCDECLNNVIFVFCSCRIEQIDGAFFERYGSGLKDTYDEDTIVAEHDKLATLTEKETSNVFKETALKTQMSYKELVSSLMELNVRIFLYLLLSFQ